MPIQINHVSYATPFAKLFRPLTESERDSLRDSINSFWVRMPVVVYHSVAHGNSIIDGANRSEIAGRIDPNREVPFTDLGRIPDTIAEELARTLNVDRRHLSPTEYQKLSAERVARMKRIATLRIGGKSLRDIAAVEKVSHEQVRNDWNRATCQPGLTSKDDSEDDEEYPILPSHIIGRDGKSYPARRAEPTDNELLNGLDIPSLEEAFLDKLVRYLEGWEPLRREWRELHIVLRKREKKLILMQRNDFNAMLKRKLAGKRA